MTTQFSITAASTSFVVVSVTTTNGFNYAIGANGETWGVGRLSDAQQLALIGQRAGIDSTAKIEIYNDVTGEESSIDLTSMEFNILNALENSGTTAQDHFSADCAWLVAHPTANDTDFMTAHELNADVSLAYKEGNVKTVAGIEFAITTHGIMTYNREALYSSLGGNNGLITYANGGITSIYNGTITHSGPAAPTHVGYGYASYLTPSLGVTDPVAPVVTDPVAPVVTDPVAPVVTPAPEPVVPPVVTPPAVVTPEPVVPPVVTPPVAPVVTEPAPEPVVQEPAPVVIPFIEVGKDGKTYFDNGSLQKANARFDQIESLTKELKPYIDNGQIMTVEIERAVDSAIEKGKVAKVDYTDMKVAIVVDKGVVAADAVVLHDIAQHKIDFNGKSLVNTLTSKDYGTFDFNAINKIVQIAVLNDGTDNANFSDVFRSEMMEFAIAELNNGVKNELDAIEVAWGNVYQFNNVCELVGVTLDQGILHVAGFDGNFVA